jgi:hypothetical protein
MIHERNKTLLRMRSRIYVALLVFLSSLSVPFFTGCGGNKAVMEGVHDDGEQTIRELQALLKAKNDSLLAARKELARMDSIKTAQEKTKKKPATKTDSIPVPKPQKPTYYHPEPAVDYGVTPYYEKPEIIIRQE